MQSPALTALSGAAIAFDLDGTLVDTAPDLVRALNRTLALEGMAPASLPAMRSFIGHGARRMIERAAAAASITFAPNKLDALTETFVDFYRADIAAESRPFPGCVEALEALRAAGARLAVCTNKRTELSRRLLDALDLARFFEAVVGADATANRKPHPDHVRDAIARIGGAPQRAAMVGDSSADAQSGRAAGVRVILVDFGYADVDVATLGADAVVSHFSDIPATAAHVFGAR
ncbi:MAG: phosphoglycolate phosphatase [Hyphomonadaceae bacterium]|nr:phosphoglycolate phosphatase [Hyphomonadaceae bacterium]